MEFRVLADTFKRLEETTARLEMMEILASLFSKATPDNVHMLIYLLQGRVAPEYEGIELGMGEKFVEEAIARATGYNKDEVERMYKEKGDLGLVAEELVKKRAQMALFSEPLTVERVYNNFRKIATAEGSGAQELKIRLLTDLLKDAEPLEARYLVRIPLGRLRLGVGDATIIEALAIVAGGRELKPKIERAYNLCSDLGRVARELLEKGPEALDSFSIILGIPLRPALAQRAKDAQEIIARLGRCAVEAKYDGFRIQVHRDGDVVKIFSRRLENMTHMFPEIIEGVKEQLRSEKVIIEGEAIAYNENTGEYLPFQVTIQRKRKYGVEELAKEFPLRLFAFDILYLDGQDVTQRPYEERRKLLESVISPGPRILLTERKIVETPEEVEEFFESCVERGLEGIIAKDLKAPYTAGARKFAWIKLKRSYKGELADTIDLVIVGYFKGRGHRAKFGIGALLGAVYDPETDTFKTVAKIGSGLTEEELVRMKELLDKIAIPHRHPRVDSLLEADVWVEPRYVITVAADEITRSPNHTCGWDGKRGYALRFPRVVGWIREDKKPEDANTVKEILAMYSMQKRVEIE